jgi:hypothetical protein
MPKKPIPEELLTEKQKKSRKYAIKSRIKNKKYFQNYSKYHYLKKLLENPNYNQENYLKKKLKQPKGGK